MKQNITPMGTFVKVVSAIVILIAIAFWVAAFYIKPLFLGAVVLTLILIWVYYCWTPVAFELKGEQLTVFYRLGEKQFSPVSLCREKSEIPTLPIKLWANGGLFAFAGSFWSRKTGTVYIYSNTLEPSSLVKLNYGERMIYISPQDPVEFVESSV